MKCLTIAGNLGSCKGLEYSQNGVPFIRFSVGVYNGKENDHPKTLWVSCTAFKKTAELFAPKLTKGAKVVAQGNPDLRVYTTQNGETRAELTMIVDAMEVYAPAAAPEQTEAPPAPTSSVTVEDVVLPNEF